MEIKARLKYLRMAPRKVRLLANLIKGLSVSEAENQLKFLSKRAAIPILKLLKSAVANAARLNLEKDNLYVSKITVDGGPILKRWLPRAMGRATPIQKRSSHITLILEERLESRKRESRRKPKTMAKIKKPPEKIKEEIQKESKEKIVEEQFKEIPRTFKAAPKKEKPGLAKRTLGFGQKIFRRKSI